MIKGTIIFLALQQIFVYFALFRQARAIKTIHDNHEEFKKSLDIWANNIVEPKSRPIAR